MTDNHTRFINNSPVNDEASFQIESSNISLNNQQEKSCIHPAVKSTHPQASTLGGRSGLYSRHITKSEIKELAKAIFRERGRGLTFEDLVKGRFKRVETEKQAKITLYNHKNKGNLYTLSPMTIPQQYFAEKEEAELAAYNDKRSIHPDPTGVQTRVHTYPSGESYPVPGSPGLLGQRIAEVIASQDAYIENLKLENLTDCVALVAQDVDGLLPMGIHNIRIHLRIPQGLAHEFYHERLAHVPASTTKDRIKHVDFRIDGFLVKCLVYEHGFVDIQIPCSQRPFPIVMQAPEVMTSLFNDFAAQIRYGLVREASDVSGRIVPPIHHPNWELVFVDYNWDIPTTMLGLKAMPKLSLKRFASDIHLRYYSKHREDDGRNFIRLERASRPFLPRGSAGRFNDAIGQTLISSAMEARREVSEFGAKGAVAAAAAGDF